MNFTRAQRVALALSLPMASITLSIPTQAQGIGGTALGGTISPPSTPFERAAGNFVAAPFNVPAAGGGTTVAEVRFPLPRVFQNPVVPTDVTGPGGSLGYSRNLRHRILGEDRNTVPDSHSVIVARDPRYSFTGQWRPFWQGQVAMAVPTVISQSAVILPSAPTVIARPAMILPSAPTIIARPAVILPGAPTVIAQPAVVLPAGTFATNHIEAAMQLPALDFGTMPVPGMPQVMTTANAIVSALGPNQLSLTNGAVMVKASDAPVDINVTLGNREQARVMLKEGAVAMVSYFDDQLSVVNLHDNRRDSVVLSMSDKARCLVGELPVRIGYMAEVYPNCAGCPQSRLVSYTVLGQNAFTNGYTAEVSRFSYPRLMKRFNITRSLNACDLRAIAKSAAAVSYLDREREWHGFTPYAP